MPQLAESYSLVVRQQKSLEGLSIRLAKQLVPLIAVYTAPCQAITPETIPTTNAVGIVTSARYGKVITTNFCIIDTTC